MTDPKDDGLRMPLPLESVVMQRPKKKKKKKWIAIIINLTAFQFIQMHSK